jgi:hypothetical protein
MILKQFYLNCLAHASYVVGDEESRLAAVIDPQRDIEQYLGVLSLTAWFSPQRRCSMTLRIDDVAPDFGAETRNRANASWLTVSR